MAACPQCQRPIAVARAQCLYCGAALDPELVPARPAASAEPAAPVEERALVLIDPTGVDADGVARLLGLSPLEAGQRIRRGWQLHRIAAPAEAETDAARLRGEGLSAVVVAESEARAAWRPSVAEGGRRTADALELRTDRGPARVSSEDLLLVVAGTIHRERQSTEPRRHRPPSASWSGYRFHLHVHAATPPIEIDPDAFAFDEALGVPAASLLELRTWLAALGATIDEGFRFVPPALGVAEAPADALLRALPSTRRPDPSAPALLDNLAQFRFYSGWRAALARRLRRS